MFRVGLTGGIASGKTIISRLFKKLGIDIIDTDEISHQLMQPGQAAYQKTIEHFGKDILHPDQSINRALLRQRVFNQPAEKKWLEDMIHPLIRQQSEKALSEATSDYALLVVPLMFETGFEDLVDYVIAIDCPTSMQKKRLMDRDDISEQLAEKMIHSQMRNDLRHARSDYILDNSNNDDLDREVRNLHLKLMGSAKRF